MRKIFKYFLRVTDEQTLDLPRGAEILSVEEQKNKVVLYALIDPAECRLYPHTIYVHGTGHSIHAENLKFIGTVKLYNGDLMFHVFTPEAQS